LILRQTPGRVLVRIGVADRGEAHRYQEPLPKTLGVSVEPNIAVEPTPVLPHPEIVRS
jgi:hypothetical protein